MSRRFETVKHPRVGKLPFAGARVPGLLSVWVGLVIDSGAPNPM